MLLNGPLVSFTTKLFSLPMFAGLHWTKEPLLPASTETKGSFLLRGDALNVLSQLQLLSKDHLLSQLVSMPCSSDLLSNVLLGSVAWIWLRTSILQFWNATHLISKGAALWMHKCHFMQCFLFCFHCFATLKFVLLLYILFLFCFSLSALSVPVFECLSLAPSRLSTACVTTCSGKLPTLIVDPIPHDIAKTTRMRQTTPMTYHAFISVHPVHASCGVPCNLRGWSEDGCKWTICQEVSWQCYSQLLC